MKYSQRRRKNTEKRNFIFRKKNSSSFLGIVLLICLSSPHQLTAQLSIKDSSISLVSANVCFRTMLPAGDFADDFGLTSTLGVEVGYKLSSNFYFRTGYNVVLDVTAYKGEDVLKGLRIGSGLIPNDEGGLSDVRMGLQGFIVPFSVGKIFPVFKKANPNSGLYVELGTQFFQHKILIRPRESVVSALSTRNLKGYDRLSNGFGFRQGLGYRHYGNHGYLNFSFGLDVSENFTQNRRSINIFSGVQETHTRKDILAGMYFCWTLPLYRRAPNTFYYN